MYRFAFRLTGHREDAQDLVQDVLLKVHERADDLDEIAALGAWLRRILYHQFIDNQRRYRQQRLRIVDGDGASDPDSAAADTPSPEELADGEFTINRLLAALAHLKEDHRLIISLHDVEGYTLTEIAEITGISLGTLKSRRQRARERLQNLLDEGPESAGISSGMGRGEENDALRHISAKPGSVS